MVTDDRRRRTHSKSFLLHELKTKKTRKTRSVGKIRINSPPLHSCVRKHTNVGKWLAYFFANHGYTAGSPQRCRCSSPHNPPLLHNPPPIIVATLHAHWHCQPSHARRQRRRRRGRRCLSIGGRTTVPRHQCPSLAHKRGVGDDGDLAPSAVPCACNNKSRGGRADNVASASTAAQWRWRQGGRQRLGIDGRPSRARQQ